MELGTWVRIEDGSLADGQVGQITRLPGDAPPGYARGGEGFPYYGATVRSLTGSLVELWMLPDEIKALPPEDDHDFTSITDADVKAWHRRAWWR